MPKIKNWTSHFNPYSPENAISSWEHDFLGLEIQLLDSQGHPDGDYRVVVIDTERRGDILVSDIGYFDNKEKAEDMATDWAEDHTTPIISGMEVPVMTEYGDISYDIVREVDDEVNGSMVRIEAGESDLRNGFEEGDTTWIERADIEDAMSLEPYERRRLHSQFQKEQDKIREGEE